MENNRTEQWRPILGGYYEISSLGRLRRAKPGENTYVGRFKKTYCPHRMYPQTMCYVNGKKYIVRIHRYVALAFLGKCPSGYEVNHKDGNKSNCKLENLEYVTKSENVKHAYRMGLEVPPKNPIRHCGDEHWTHKHPELVKRGNENGAHLHPECILRGERVHTARFTAEDVRTIRKLHDGGIGPQAIARKYDTSCSNICCIVRRKTWKHIK